MNVRKTKAADKICGRLKWLKYIVGSGLGMLRMLKFVRKPWKPMKDHALWPCSLRVESNFVRCYSLCIQCIYIYMYIYIYIHICTHNIRMTCVCIVRTLPLAHIRMAAWLPRLPAHQDRAESVSKSCEQRVEMVREQSQQLMEQTRIQAPGKWWWAAIDYYKLL